jgi:hypothetical protein
MATLYAAASRTILTPPVGIAHAAWGAQTHSRAAGVDLDLLGTVLVVASDDVVAAFVDVEYCIVEKGLADEIRRAVASLAEIPFEAVRLSYTHTHSGPMLGPSWLHDGDEMIPSYVASIPDRLAGAAWEARRALRPARIAVAHGACDIGVNRRLRLPNGRVVCGRNWDGYVDREVQVVRVDDLDEQAIATIVNFACHPTIMGPPNQLVTPDYPGVVRRVVEEAVGGKCLFLQGATGNIHAIVDYVGDPAVYRRLGAVLGHEASKLALRMRTLPTRERLVEVWDSGAPLGIYADEPDVERDATVAVQTVRFQLPIRDYPPISELEERYESLKARLASLRENGPSPELIGAVGEARRTQLFMDLARKYEGQPTTEVELHGLRIGDVAFVGFPGEPFAEIGAAVKSSSPFAHTIFGGYTNGYFGYVPTDEAFPLGGYEVEISTPFRPGAAGVIVGAAADLLRRLHDPNGQS